MLAAGLMAYYGWSYESAVRLGPRSSRVFHAFARVDVSPDQFGRMRGDLVPMTAKPAAAPWHLVSQVLDGDTIRLEDGRTVRLVGVDTPESSENRKMYTDLGKMNLADAQRDLLALGRAAAKAASDRALGRRCWLETGRNAEDQYGRLLAIVHLDDGTILNEWLIHQGYARVETSYPFPYRKRYIGLQLMAQRGGNGFWNLQEEL